MLRIICRVVDEAAAIHIGSLVSVKYETFDVELPQVEEFLLLHKGDTQYYQDRSVVGIEVIAKLDKIIGE
jgi:hypothetical protein